MIWLGVASALIVAFMAWALCAAASRVDDDDDVR